jgi:hypothetical protein
VISTGLNRAIDEYGRAAAARGNASVAQVLVAAAPTTIAERGALVDALLAELAGWKKGVEAANRIAQEHAARADRAEAALEATRPRTDALYDALGAARAFLAVFLREERGERAFVRGTPDSVLEVSDAMQRLRDTLFETRGALLGGKEHTR